MISCSYSNRKRLIALPAASTVRMSWRALPVSTGDVRPDVAGGQFAGTTAFATVPGHLAWSPPI